MKVGDLITVRECNNDMGIGSTFPCHCFLCSGNSNRIGFVLGPAPGDNWCIMFDCGEWKYNSLDEESGDVKVLCSIENYQNFCGV